MIRLWRGEWKIDSNVFPKYQPKFDAFSKYQKTLRCGYPTIYHFSVGDLYLGYPPYVVILEHNLQCQSQTSTLR